MIISLPFYVHKNLHSDNEKEFCMSSTKIYDKNLYGYWGDFEIANHLTLIACFATYEKIWAY